MTSKILSLFLMTAILSIFCLTIVSALDFTISTPDTLTKLNTQTSFTITNNDIVDLDLEITNPLTIDDGNGNSITLSYSTLPTNLIASGAETIDITYSESLEDLDLGDYTITINVEATDDNGTPTDTSDDIIETKTTTLTASNSYCSDGNLGDLEIDRLKFSNNGIGDKDEWYLTDEIEVEVRVENNGNEDIDDVIVEWGLYNKRTGEFIIDDEEKDFNLDEDEDETLEFIFKLDPNDFDEDDDEDDFVFYIKAYSDDLGEDNQCTAETEDITIKRDKHFVILTDIILVSDSIPCDGYLEGDLKAWNLGEDDEQDVFIRVYNQELEIDERINIGDIDILEDKKFSFSVKIPKDINEKTYELQFEVYDEDSDIFENDDDDEAIFLSPIFKVEGNCNVQEEQEMPKVQITAQLDSSTPLVAGEEVIVKALIRNLENEQGIFTISVLENSAWSSVIAIDPQTLVLQSGEAREVNILLSIDEGVEGDKSLKLKVANVERQIDLVGIESSEQEIELGPFLQHMKVNWFIYVIILVNLILIIAIILVVRRMLAPSYSQ